jgi:hypothetical protein
VSCSWLVGSQDRGHTEYEDPTLWHIASTPGLPPALLVKLPLGQAEDGALQVADLVLRLVSHCGPATSPG